MVSFQHQKRWCIVGIYWDITGIHDHTWLAEKPPSKTGAEMGTSSINGLYIYIYYIHIYIYLTYFPLPCLITRGLFSLGRNRTCQISQGLNHCPFPTGQPLENPLPKPISRRKTSQEDHLHIFQILQNQAVETS